MNIVPLATEKNMITEEVKEILTESLDMQLQNCVVIGQLPDGSTYLNYSGTTDCVHIVGMLELAKHDFLLDWAAVSE